MFVGWQHFEAWILNTTFYPSDEKKDVGDLSNSGLKKREQKVREALEERRKRLQELQELQQRLLAQLNAAARDEAQVASEIRQLEDQHSEIRVIQKGPPKKKK